MRLIRPDSANSAVLILASVNDLSVPGLVASSLRRGSRFAAFLRSRLAGRGRGRGAAAQKAQVRQGRVVSAEPGLARAREASRRPQEPQDQVPSVTDQSVRDGDQPPPQSGDADPSARPSLDHDGDLHRSTLGGYS